MKFFLERQRLNSGFCTQARSQDRRAVWASGQGRGRLWVLALKLGHDEERWQVLKTLLWPWLRGQDTGWLTSKCDFITGVQRGPWVTLKAQELGCCFQLQGKLPHFGFLIHGLRVWARILPRSFSTMVLCDSKKLGRYLERSCASETRSLQARRNIFLF